MHLSKESVNSYIEFFVRNVIGFEKEEIKFTHIAESSDEYLLIAMDRIARLERQGGRLRQRVWNNVFFIFHENQFLQNDARKEKISDVKRIHPHLFIRSYVYFVFIDATRLSGGTFRIDTSDFKIWLFNSKYEIREILNKQNLFNFVLKENEKLDDYMYITNTELELIRLRSANSDAIDCVRAFTSELPLLEQTVNMFNKVTEELDNNENAHIIVEGPARSGKTIIAASLLGKYPNSKFLLMNAFFYQAIVDGFYALSSFTSEEIDSLVKNKELDLLIELKNNVPVMLKRIVNNLDIIIEGLKKDVELSMCKVRIVKEVDKVIESYKECKIDFEEHRLYMYLCSIKSVILADQDDIIIIERNLSKLKEISSILKNVNDSEYSKMIELSELVPESLHIIAENIDFLTKNDIESEEYKKAKEILISEIKRLSERIEENGEYKLLAYLKKMSEHLSTSSFLKSQEDDFKVEQLVKVRESILKSLNGDYKKIVSFQDIITKSISVLIENSKQRFFHHNINKELPKKIIDGCWITRGNPTTSKMWDKYFSPNLIICDEVQRLGTIEEYYSYDKFDEIKELLSHSKQTFFTGDNFQMLNYQYDKGLNEIAERLSIMNKHLSRFELPESVGIPAEIGLLMKYLSGLSNVSKEDIINNWDQERLFNIVVIEQNQDRLVKLFDEDNSNKKHFASPMDLKWLRQIHSQNIITKHRASQEIVSLSTKGKSFAYTFPYFCNEEIMPNYYLSAYELISRELDSLYINVPKFDIPLEVEDERWFKNHLYVLYTRPTSTLVINFQDRDEYRKVEKIVSDILEAGVKVPIVFLPNIEYKSVRISKS